MKVQRIYESSLEINFNSPGQEFSLYWDSFLKSEIGKIYVAVPWQELIHHFKINEFLKGPSRFFSPQGMLGLMFLKSYVGCSDRKLGEHLNGNINFQLFCDIFLQGERLTNFKIVSQIRTFLSSRLNIEQAQKILARTLEAVYGTSQHNAHRCHLLRNGNALSNQCQITLGKYRLVLRTIKDNL